MTERRIGSRLLRPPRGSVAEPQLRRIIGYRDLATFVVAIERHALLAAQPNTDRQEVAEAVVV